MYLEFAWKPLHQEPVDRLNSFLWGFAWFHVYPFYGSGAKNP
jgi:hypothetical protein